MRGDLRNAFQTFQHKYLSEKGNNSEPDPFLTSTDAQVANIQIVLILNTASTFKNLPIIIQIEHIDTNILSH